MNIFVTGIAGFLGSHMAEHFLKQGHIVKGNDNLSGGYKENIPQMEQFYNVDCCDLEGMTQAMAGTDVLIHAAATAHEGLSVFSPHVITKNIFEASVSTFTAAIRCGVKRIVFCSSMARYGNQESPFVETMQPMPCDPYAIAKVAAEDVLKLLCKVHNVEWNIVVPHNIIGPRQRYDDPYRNVVSIMINRNLQGKPAIVYGDGEQVRCFSYIDDCVSCIEKTVTNKDIVHETINIGPDEDPISINTLAQLVANATGFNGDVIYYDDRPQEVKVATCSSDKARVLLDYKTSTTLQQGIQKTTEYIKAAGTKQFDYSLGLEIINEKTPSTWKDKII